MAQHQMHSAAKETKHTCDNIITASELNTLTACAHDPISNSSYARKLFCQHDTNRNQIHNKNHFAAKFQSLTRKQS